MFTPTITKEMLRELHRRMRLGIANAGNRTEYFAAGARLGYRLTTSGWQLAEGRAVTANRLVAITDRDLHDRLKTATSPAACFDQIVTEGMAYDTDWEESPVGVHGETGDLDRVDLPRPEQDPRMVTVDLDYMRPMRWPEAHWFDLKRATPVARVRTNCCEADPGWSEPHPPLEIMLWRTQAGRWVGEITDPTQVGEQFDPAQPAWAEIAPEWAAHAIWCQDEAELTDQARTVPLAAAALAARGVSDPGAIDGWGMEQIRGDDRHCSAHHGHLEHAVALRTMLIAALGHEAAQVWQDAGQALADWTWIEHGPITPDRYGARWHSTVDESADTD